MEKKNIYSKLLEFQKLDIAVEKDGENPHYKSSYATLNEVLSKVKRPLNDLGILIIQSPESNGLRTRLYDTESETSIECFMPYVETTTAQKLGSNNTYNRRYSLVTLLGLEDEDDDGNVASLPSKRPVEASKPSIKEEIWRKVKTLRPEANKANVSKLVEELTKLSLLDMNYNEINSRLSVLISERK